MPLGQWTTSILYVIAIYSEAKESEIEGEYTVKLINRALKLFPGALLIALLFADPFDDVRSQMDHLNILTRTQT